jgi:hypothetical protein
MDDYSLCQIIIKVRQEEHRRIEDFIIISTSH